jgi:hypothetical protein
VTAKERAEETLPRLYGRNGSYRGPLNAKAQIEAAITAALDEQRLRHAGLVSEFPWNGHDQGSEILAEIADAIMGG